MRRIILSSAGLILLTSPALAHVGAGGTSSVLSGLMHPMGGLDHVAAMFAVGAWSALAGGKSLWAWPLAFVAAMLFGAIVAASGVAVPMVEPLIAASVVAAGILVLLAARLPLAVGATLVAAFALVHGHAHGTEAAANSLLPYMAGFAVATAAMHVAGIAFVQILRRFAGMIPVRASGAVIAATGAYLLLK